MKRLFRSTYANSRIQISHVVVVVVVIFVIVIIFILNVHLLFSAIIDDSTDTKVLPSNSEKYTCN